MGGVLNGIMTRLHPPVEVIVRLGFVRVVPVVVVWCW